MQKVGLSSQSLFGKLKKKNKTWLPMGQPRKKCNFESCRSSLMLVGPHCFDCRLEGGREGRGRERGREGRNESLEHTVVKKPLFRTL